MKLFGQIDLDIWSKICVKFKLPRRSLQGDMAVTRTENDLSPSLPSRIFILHFSGLKLFSDN
jgi:hypothetical protein